ncbi:activating signal cointegrator 1 complex subunit 2 homolog [Gymnodraco acuticeps]|uniref:Activating signal cointegrator 1 complex subunit 2 homolog n=1 Tax=Gymnodraco acuticeps TaxID=8218 RepID=A0A6P8SRP3_GYMAC|nr:activating signal cointegrator 1 complex subunit 2 homolog [Gymnodraco acuticeps]
MQDLLQQTGQALHPDSEETAQLIEEHEDVMEDDEGFSDIRHSAGPRGPAGSSLSDSLWHFHPGPQQNHPGPQQNHPGPQQNHPGPQQNHPGSQQNHPGPQQNHPGPQQNHPGSQHNHRSPEQNDTDPKPICTGLC